MRENRFQRLIGERLGGANPASSATAVAVAAADARRAIEV
jgi:hypothetical protein